MHHLLRVDLHSWDLNGSLTAEIQVDFTEIKVESIHFREGKKPQIQFAQRLRCGRPSVEVFWIYLSGAFAAFQKNRQFWSIPKIIDETVDGRNPAITTWDENLVNSGINHLSTGAGFLPSTGLPNKTTKKNAKFDMLPQSSAFTHRKDGRFRGVLGPFHYHFREVFQSSVLQTEKETENEGLLFWEAKKLEKKKWLKVLIQNNYVKKLISRL